MAKQTMMATVKAKLPGFDVYSVKDEVFTVRRGFFYTHGQTADDFVKKVKTAFPTAVIIESGEVWKSFRGGASVTNQSHWYVKFMIPIE